MARRLGASPFGQVLAGLCALTAPFYLAFFSFYSVNAFEILFWTLGGCLLLELIRSGDRRLWLGLGVLAGIALLNKHTFALFGAGLGVAVLATPLRTELRTPWPWLAAGSALLIALPNLLWNAGLDWPSLAFYQSVGADKNLPTPPLEALILQIAGLNPMTLLVWLPGLGFLLFSKQIRPYRPLGVAVSCALSLHALLGATPWGPHRGRLPHCVRGRCRALGPIDARALGPSSALGLTDHDPGPRHLDAPDLAPGAFT